MKQILLATAMILSASFALACAANSPCNSLEGCKSSVIAPATQKPASSNAGNNGLGHK